MKKLIVLSVLAAFAAWPLAAMAHEGHDHGAMAPKGKKKAKGKKKMKKPIEQKSQIHFVIPTA